MDRRDLIERVIAELEKAESGEASPMSGPSFGYPHRSVVPSHGNVIGGMGCFNPTPVPERPYCLWRFTICRVVSTIQKIPFQFPLETPFRLSLYFDLN